MKENKKSIILSNKKSITYQKNNIKNTEVITKKN